ncbi:rhombosortase [Aeromonas bivalvium]|uniref:rhombosortase n=1 Tax=Aeromonas bivalvium TaxID=440079 RepID=UPI0038D067A2
MSSVTSGLFWLITLSLACLILFFTVPNDLISFNRALIDQGEGWRIITGNLAHTNLWHLLLNLAGLLVLYALFCDYLQNWGFPLLLALLAIAVGLGIWYYYPHTQWYMGLSGVLHGLFVWGAMADIRHRRYSGWLMLLGITIKLWLDHYTGGDSPAAMLIGARVHTGSHLVGAGAGLVLGLLTVVISFWRARR